MASPGIPENIVFINHLDEFHGDKIGQFLSKCMMGASMEELEDEEEEEDGNKNNIFSVEATEGCFEIVGTLKNKDNPKPDWARYTIDNSSIDALKEQLLEADVIIYDITEDSSQIDEAIWVANALQAELEQIVKPKTFILISSIMTWSKSKPLDPDDPDIPYTDDDYRRRKAHQNFRQHCDAEKSILKIGRANKLKLNTYVLAAGLTYGCGEGVFHYFFKESWHNSERLECFGQGSNIVPTIHVKDLAAIIQNIIDSKPSVKYLLAVDDSKSTLIDIVKSVSKKLGNGKTKVINKEEALLKKDIKQKYFDMLLVNLKMDGIFIKENMRIRWQSEAGIVENIDKIVKEYKDTRSLQPKRVIILGPPVSGKTTVCKKLCDHYKLHHIQLKDVIDEAMDKLENSKKEVNDEGEEDVDNVDDMQDNPELLEAIKLSKEENNGRIEDQFVIKFFKQKLHSSSCQNQGFILDGYPRTLEQANELFAAIVDDDDDADKSPHDNLIMPDAVICLEGDDEYLKGIVMNLEEKDIVDSLHTEAEFTRRLENYRAMNSVEEESVTNYFDEIEIHPEKIDVSIDLSPLLQETVDRIKLILGKPQNYGPTSEELKQILKNDEKQRFAKEIEDKDLREKKEAAEDKERKQRQEEWSKRLEQFKEEEADLLETQSIPLRNYLMKHVMPTLQTGLLECCKLKPEDPIDFLAEYLFKHSMDD